MSIEEIKNLFEKYAGNFAGEDLAKIKANGEDLISTLGNMSGGLGSFAKSALGKLGIGDGDSNGIVEKVLSALGGMAKSDTAKADFSKLEDAIKKFIG